jgi:hypothetical protein
MDAKGFKFKFRWAGYENGIDLGFWASSQCCVNLLLQGGELRQLSTNSPIPLV